MMSLGIGEKTRGRLRTMCVEEEAAGGGGRGGSDLS